MLWSVMTKGFQQSDLIQSPERRVEKINRPLPND